MNENFIIIQLTPTKNMKKIKSSAITNRIAFYLLLISLPILFIGCKKEKTYSVNSSYSKELAKEIEHKKRIKKILTDDLCTNIIQEFISKEIDYKIDLSDCIVKLSKHPYNTFSTFTGEDFFEGKVKGKKSTYNYTITVSNKDNENLTDKSKWALKKLIIKDTNNQKKVLFAGEGVWEIGDFLFIDGKKVTMTSNNGTAQKFITQSKLNKEQIMKLWECRERPYAGIINLYLPNQSSNYAMYNDKDNTLFMFSQNKIYKITQSGKGLYKFTEVKL